MGGMTNEESAERYWIEIGTEKVAIVDDETGGRTFFRGPDRLLAATAELNRLNAEQCEPDFAAKLAAQSERAWQQQIAEPVTHAMLPAQVTAAGKSVTPASFLAETLPAVARRQRLEAQLAEVTEIEERYTRLVSQDAKSLATATDLRRRIEEALARPLCATLPDENAPGVGQDTPTFPRLTETFKQECYPLSKPGPY